MLKDIFKDVDLCADNAISRDRHPAGRAGREEEMAGTILYLSSRAGAYCAGMFLISIPEDLILEYLPVLCRIRLPGISFYLPASPLKLRSLLNLEQEAFSYSMVVN